MQGSAIACPNVWPKRAVRPAYWPPGYGVVLAITALLLSPLAASVLFLLQAGELSSATSVAKGLVRNYGIFGTALHNFFRLECRGSGLRL